MNWKLIFFFMIVIGLVITMVISANFFQEPKIKTINNVNCYDSQNNKILEQTCEEVIYEKINKLPNVIFVLCFVGIIFLMFFFPIIWDTLLQ